MKKKSLPVLSEREKYIKSFSARMAAVNQLYVQLDEKEIEVASIEARIKEVTSDNLRNPKANSDIFGDYARARDRKLGVMKEIAQLKEHIRRLELEHSRERIRFEFPE